MSEKSTLSARALGYQGLNGEIRRLSGQIEVNECFGERFIAAAATKDKSVTINGTPGNALGAYLDGANIVVRGNAQDATGDTMNEGRIVIHGGAGDALGYAMRGGAIFVRDDTGYRTGIHMKQYLDKCPAIIVGGRTGSFLGEYMAGGLIVILGLKSGGKPPVGYYTGTGIHGGKIFLRCEEEPGDLPKQAILERAAASDIEEIAGYVREFCEYFGNDADEILKSSFYVLTPNAKNPYKQLYTNN